MESRKAPEIGRIARFERFDRFRRFRKICKIWGLGGLGEILCVAKNENLTKPRRAREVGSFRSFGRFGGSGDFGTFGKFVIRCKSLKRSRGGRIGNRRIGKIGDSEVTRHQEIREIGRFAGLDEIIICGKK